MGQYFKQKPSNNLISGYNNDITTNTSLIVGSYNKLNTPFVSITGTNNFVKGGFNLSACHVVGHNNSVFNTKGIIYGNGNTVVANQNTYVFGDNNTLASGVSNSYIFGNNVNATNSNTFVIGADLVVLGTINGSQNIVGATGAQGATGPAGASGTAYTPTSLQDPFGNVGDITFDNFFLYIKTNQGWCSTALTPLQKQPS